MHSNRTRFVGGLLAAAGGILAACGKAPPLSREPAPAPIPQAPASPIFDPAGLYQNMGLFVTGQPLAFVAGLRFLAGPVSDSTIVVVGISIPNGELVFRCSGDTFKARYRVEVGFRRGGRVVAQFATDEVVRVGTFGETQRTDESVIYQQFMVLPPGTVLASIAVRDRFGSGFNRTEHSVEVPRFLDTTQLSGLIAIYRGGPRASRAALPRLLLNPRATASYGTDTLQFYLEGYALGADRSVIVRARTRGDSAVVWSDSIQLVDDSLAGAVVRLDPEALPVGELEFEAGLPGRDTVRAGALVSFSRQVGDFQLRAVAGVPAILRSGGRDPADARRDTLPTR